GCIGQIPSPGRRPALVHPAGTSYDGGPGRRGIEHREDGNLMKIQLLYDDPHKIKTDLVAIVLDKDLTLHDLGRSRLGDVVARVREDFASKTLRREYLGPRPDAGAGHVVVYSTEFDPAFNVWENVKTYV